MALTRSDYDLKWSTATSKSVTSSAVVWTDAVALDATDVSLSVFFKADNSGTPQAGDTCAVYVAWTTDGSNYDTAKHAKQIASLDTNVEDPAAVTVDLPVSAKGFQIGAICPNAGTRNVTITGHYSTQRAA